MGSKLLLWRCSMFSKRNGMRAALLAAVLATTACETSTQLTREDKISVATIAGAVIGGALGYELFGSGSGQLIGLSVGAAGGAVGGYMLGDRLTRLDKRSMAEAEYDSLTHGEAGSETLWNNSESGNSGEVKPIRTFLSATGEICRDYMAKVTVEGETVERQLRACQNAKGDWIRA